MFRILIVEDDPARERILRSWIPNEVRVVVANSAGAAIGILKRDVGTVYSGIVLDHDLQQRRASEADKFLSGLDVLSVIARYVSRDVPVLIHSMNASQSTVMARELQRAGFDVTQIPMEYLTHELFCGWLAEAEERYKDRL